MRWEGVVEVGSYHRPIKAKNIPLLYNFPAMVPFPPDVLGEVV